jgi:predicted ester cyclase/ketosteroid isomerase-like protein
MHKFVALMHRYCHDYTNRQDFTVCDSIMVPEYILHMGTHVVAGRDTAYKPATNKQFQQFPGLCLTINELVTNADRLCLRFSEHGSSVRHAGALAAWSGIGLYKWDGERLTENFVEQDYYSRRAQLARGTPLPVEASAIAPWDVQPAAPNPAAERIVRELLEGGDLTQTDGVVFDDEWTGTPRQRVIEPSGAVIDDLFSAGDQVAFHAALNGPVAEDFSTGDVAVARGRDAVLHMSGLVTLRDGRIIAGRVIRDRLGLYRRLTA